MNAVRAVAILVIHINCVRTELCRSKYSLANVCPADYGQWLDDVSGVVTSSSCSELCAANTACISFLFGTGSCQLNAEEALTFSQSCTTRVVYGLIEKATCRQHWLHEPCGTCPVPNSHCENSVCICNNGYTYHRKSDSCVADCATYGRQFTLQPGALSMFDTATHLDKTFSECVALCLAETSFVCRSMELIPGIDTQACYLVTETALTQPAAYVVTAPHHTYRRNCA